MDVRCTRCGVEYEFDEAKVKPAGVTVKCTSCGHVFKVKPEGVVPDEPVVDAVAGDAWTVRTHDGATLSFKELTTLQKWIVEQKVHRQDQISKTGKSWKPLGEIAELASFFQVVDAANQARSAAAAAGASLPPSAGQPLAMPPPTDPSGPPSQMAGEPPPAQPTPAQPTPDQPAAQPPPEQPPPLAEHSFDESAPQPPPSVSGEFFAGSPVGELDDEDPVLQWRRRARARNTVIAIVFLLVAGVAGLYFGAPDTFQDVFGPVLSQLGVEQKPQAPKGPDPVVTRIDDALRGDEPKARAELIAEVTAVIDGAASSQGPPAAQLAALARLHVAAARYSRDLSRLFEAGSSEQRAALADADKNLSTAYALANDARSRDATRPDTDAAFADYQAAKGAVAEMASDIDAARGKLAGSDREVLAAELDVIALLGQAAAALGGSDASALEAADTALAGGPQSDPRVRVTWLLLRAARAGDDAAARGAVGDEADKLLTLRGDDARVKRVKDRFAATAPAADADQAKDAGAAPAQEEPSPDEVTEPAPPGDKPPAGGKPASYGKLMKQADRNRIRERTKKALALYEQAAQLKPSAAKPWAGIGWCYLDLDQPGRAVDAFNKAIGRAGGLAEAHFGRAEALSLSGNKAKAAASYRRYLELAPNGPDAAVARNALKSM
jgi:predicted Zn finger-like uncharacterized protein